MSPRHLLASAATSLSGALVLTALAVAPAAAIPPPAQYTVTGRVSVSSSGAQATSGFAPRITPDGRYVAFTMVSPSAYPAAGPFGQVYRRDQWTGTVVLASPGVTANQVPNGPSDQASISDDGRWLAFSSTATNLVQGDVNGHKDVFLRDMDANVTHVISVASGGGSGNGDSLDPMIDGAGDKVAFDSLATNLVSGDTNNATDVFVRSWISDVTTRISVSTASAQGNGPSQFPAISGDGGWVAFESSATNLVSGDVNAKTDVFERSLAGSTTRLVSRQGNPANGASVYSSVSNDGSEVAFDSTASNLVANDTNNSSDTFLWTRSTGAIQRVSVNAFGGQIAKGSYFGSALSRDGNVVVWTALGDDVTIPAGNGLGANVYTRNLSTSFTKLISIDATGHPGNAVSFDLSADETGRFIAYDDASASLVRHDTNVNWDAFVTDTQLVVAPFIDVQSFVDQQFKDFLGRPPTSAEEAEGVAVITNGELSPSRYVVAKIHDPAWSLKRAPVLRLYWTFFLREPDMAGYLHWLGVYQSGHSLADIAQAFAQSPEFTGKYGSLSDSGFVKLVYANVLNRQPDAFGLSYWVDQLQHHGLTRGGLMVGFSESLEGQHVIAPVTDTLLTFLGMLRGLPTQSGFNIWRQGLGTPPVTSILTGFIMSSPAYASRFP